MRDTGKNYIAKRYLKLIMLVLTISVLSSTSMFAANVARIGRRNYSSLQRAVNAARSGQTIMLLRNVTLRDSLDFKRRGNFTLNLNRKTITVDTTTRTRTVTNSLGEREKQIHYGEINIRKGNVKFKNGRIRQRQSNRKYVADKIVIVKKNARLTIDSGTYIGGFGNYGTMTINNGTFKEFNDDLLLFLNDGTMVINNGTFSAFNMFENFKYLTIQNGRFSSGYHFISSVKTNYQKYAAKVTINNGTFSKASSEQPGCTFLSLSNSSATINGGRFTGPGTMNIMDKGYLTLTGGTISSSINSIMISKGGTFKMTGGTVESTEKPSQALLNGDVFADQSVAVAMYVYGTANLQAGTIKGGYYYPKKNPSTQEVVKEEISPINVKGGSVSKGSGLSVIIANG